MRSPTAQLFIDREINGALTRAGVPHNCRTLREILSRDAMIMGVRDPYVRISDGRGTTISLDDRLRELRDNPRYHSSFSADAPEVARTDLELIRRNFEAVAQGIVKVVD